MGLIVLAQSQEFAHERDDLLDELARLEEATLKGDGNKVSIQHQRISAHLRRLEEMERLAKLLEENGKGD